jgi:hypothetical protein
MSSYIFFSFLKAWHSLFVKFKRYRSELQTVNSIYVSFIWVSHCIMLVLIPVFSYSHDDRSFSFPSRFELQFSSHEAVVLALVLQAFVSLKYYALSYMHCSKDWFKSVHSDITANSSLWLSHKSCSILRSSFSLSQVCRYMTYSLIVCFWSSLTSYPRAASSAHELRSCFVAAWSTNWNSSSICSSRHRVRFWAKRSFSS